MLGLFWQDIFVLNRTALSECRSIVFMIRAVALDLWSLQCRSEVQRTHSVFDPARRRHSRQKRRHQRKKRRRREM